MKRGGAGGALFGLKHFSSFNCEPSSSHPSLHPKFSSLWITDLMQNDIWQHSTCDRTLSLDELSSLSDEELRQLLRDATLKRTNFEAHDFQLKASIAHIRRKDLVVVAGTGGGKTLAFVMQCFVSNVRAVIISPLNALQDEQVSLQLVSITSDINT